MEEENKPAPGGIKLLRTEDYWAIWLGLLVIIISMGFFYAGSTIKPWAVTPGVWNSPDSILKDLAEHAPGFILTYLGFGIVFTISMKLMNQNLKHYIPGYTILFLGALAIFYLAGWSVVKKMDLGAPLLALIIGLVIGNIRKMPAWFETALRTEYYIKAGIVLLGATLPLTLIFEAGPIAFIQATIVSICTWLTIFLAATKIFKLDKRFGAVLGTGGAVCGVSGSIAIGGAVKAEKDHISIGIGVVSVWAIVMIFSLALLTKNMIPADYVTHGKAAITQWYHISPGESGAWVGTSEYADAAGFAVVAELAQKFGEAPIQAFTLMKVIGRDIWIGIWAFVLSIVSVVFWEKKDGSSGPSGRLGIGVVWERFPKFVLGFFAASIIMSFIAATPPADHPGGSVGTRGMLKNKGTEIHYNADFTKYQVPPALASKFIFDASAGKISFKGNMTQVDGDLLKKNANQQQKLAINNLFNHANWFFAQLKARAIGPIKQLRLWAFVLCFLGIGLSTRFKDLATFGLKPFWAFTIGVLVNVPLGFLLSTRVFVDYWRNL